MKLLIGTSNPGKAAELAGYVGELGFEIVTLADLGIASVEETGETFEENAVLKAKAYAAASGLPTLADDAGLEVDVLGGAPGVRTHRWLGEDVTDLKLFFAILDKMRGVPMPKRSARLKVVLALATPGGNVVTVARAAEGKIVEEQDARPDKIPPGYPFKSLLMLDAVGKLYCDLTEEEHLAINHRRLAVQDLLPHLEAIAQHA
ncbi:MAG: non-canonical purine NTP pyrophosphatase [Patescibacteria group bacterium]